MKRKIFFTDSNEKKAIAEVKEFVGDVIGCEWQLLQVPLIVGITMIDMLFVRADGQLCVVKILNDAHDISQAGDLCAQYATLISMLPSLANVYDEGCVDATKAPVLKLFIPHAVGVTYESYRYFGFALQIYPFSFMTATDGESSVLIHGIQQPIARMSSQSTVAPCASRHMPPASKAETVKKREDRDKEYETLLKIMGENARSEESTANDIVLNVPHVQAEEPVDEGADDTPAKERQNVFERGQLNEKELLAFFKLEKKIDGYPDKTYN